MTVTVTGQTSHPHPVKVANQGQSVRVSLLDLSARNIHVYDTFSFILEIMSDVSVVSRQNGK